MDWLVTTASFPTCNGMALGIRTRIFDHLTVVECLSISHQSTHIENWRNRVSILTVNRIPPKRLK